MRVLLNGVGRIGKAILRIAQEDNSLNIVAINELNTKLENITYSINYDSTYGKLQDKFVVNNDHIKNSHFNIKILNEKSLEDIDYDDLKIDIVIDASGAKVNTQILKHSNEYTKNKKKLINHLLYKGFSPENVRSILNKLNLLY